ncbi:hypothetical protein HanXRQr2_Chr11g0470691 [Helianthus annuus]|uniref:Uncharacterized protein n=1 Tax=Helianthus annuus TaxID=4232 RepID=A0A9K3HKW4_HELAN|nr:hypothetical protein HanXRQr2_Chr11g0470691 [Helianthus annuus]
MRNIPPTRIPNKEPIFCGVDDGYECVVMDEKTSSNVSNCVFKMYT